MDVLKDLLFRNAVKTLCEHLSMALSCMVFYAQFWCRHFFKIALCKKYDTEAGCDFVTSKIVTELSVGKIQSARKTFRWYLSIVRDKSLIERNLALAAFADENGFSTVGTKMAVRVYQSVKASHDRKLFAELVAGKTVAVVGNGPYEVGRKLGHEIDAHDIVIRFNNFASQEYEIDYGGRVDIWSKASIDYIDHTRVGKVSSMVIHDRNLECATLKSGYVNAANEMLDKGLLVDYYPQELRESLSAEMRKAPTTGFLMIAALRQSRAKYMDAYGFSFLEDGTSQETYCNVGQTISSNEMKYNVSFHDINFEIAYLKKLFNGGRRLVITADE